MMKANKTPSANCKLFEYSCRKLVFLKFVSYINLDSNTGTTVAL